ncbi:MAG: hypothetical protein KKB51_01720 [Candidatus Riflebacteria bacterium]|nr:hypothetical protein [Candidatus Riflebacteria bacterium]
MNDNLFLFDDFITELSEDNSPGHLDQLELFYEDTDELFKTLTEIITSSQLAVTYASVHKDSLPALKPNEPVGYLLQWPDPQCGLTTLIHSDQAAAGTCSSFVAVFPFISDGIRYSCRVLETRLFSNRLEAQLVVLAGEDELLSLTFYDARYAADRVVYQKDTVYQFILRGFAYHLELCNSEDSAMSALFPRTDLGADHYEIQGPVTTIKAMATKMLQQQVWLLSVTIAQTEADEPLDIEICLTAKILGKTRLPEIGDNVSAVIWLQGHLWNSLL